MKLIQIDGATGGGQMLRTALSLAMITGQPFRMTNIRGKRSKPGLMRQHLTCVKAAAQISGGVTDGAEIGSTELVFRAGDRIQGGEHHFAIGTAGSTSLLFQTLLPALLQADGPSTLWLEGGTHNPQAPPFEFIERVFLPALRGMGAQVEVKLQRTGFAPAGGGKIECQITPIQGKLAPFDLTERPEKPLSVRLRVLTSNLPLSIAGRMLDAALELLPEAREDATVENREPTPGQGVCCLAEADFGSICEVGSAFGEPGTRAEVVGKRAAKGVKDYLGCGAVVGRHLADQLVLPMALAGGGSFVCMSPDDHLATNIGVISKFLPVEFLIESAARGCKQVSLA